MPLGFGQSRMPPERERGRADDLAAAARQKKEEREMGIRFLAGLVSLEF